jgi:hypothetical protein
MTHIAIQEPIRQECRLVGEGQRRTIQARLISAKRVYAGDECSIDARGPLSGVARLR